MPILRSIGKTCFAAAYRAGRAVYGMTNRAVTVPSMPFIVCYHRVVENFNRSAANSIPSMLISTRMLERHIDWLAKRFSIVSLDDIGLHLQTGRASSRPLAAITFDDGYGDVYHNAMPLLKRKGVPAAVFVVSDLVGTGKPQVFDRLYILLRTLQSNSLPLSTSIAPALREIGVPGLDMRTDVSTGNEALDVITLLLNGLSRETVESLIRALEGRVTVSEDALQECMPVTWEMAETMRRNGITIGSHTRSHTLLTSETLETAGQQLAQSKTAIESKLRTEVKHFAYPDGRFNSAVVGAVNAAGYQFAYSICGVRDSRFPLLTIPRTVLWERASLNAWGGFSPAIMTCHVHGAFESQRGCAHNHSEIALGENEWNDQLSTL